MECNYCGKEAELVTGAEVYPHLPNLAAKKFYRCVPCDARVGTHPGTDRPLGNLANADLRRIRSQVHRAFDPIWKDRRMSRSKAYARLARAMGIPVDECHVGMFDVERCEIALAVLRKTNGLREVPGTNLEGV